ncbi:hypothetical protein BE08_34480 [Sorangium cellulosum]|uniref:Uncharacterized protein n=1 Tax=Sorangium cellulosum TaxID=56 RepID=A0A150PNH3_SORCE|nr:hypothetical protein BE08_34480 [Sorangium cellulosum]
MGLGRAGVDPPVGSVARAWTPRSTLAPDAGERSVSNGRGARGPPCTSPETWYEVEPASAPVPPRKAGSSSSTIRP